MRPSTPSSACLIGADDEFSARGHQFVNRVKEFLLCRILASDELHTSLIINRSAERSLVLNVMVSRARIAETKSNMKRSADI